MQEFLDLLKENFSQEDYEYISNVYYDINRWYEGDKLFGESFAKRIATTIYENRLDINSIIIGLIYPIYKSYPEILDREIFNDNIRQTFHRLAKIESLNLSTHQDQLDNIKNMFIALAKDIRVMIIKLCIEQSKLSFLDCFKEEEIEKYMKEITDVYFPICQMIGLSTIKNDFGNATFKYYKPAMYQELTEALNLYMEERNSNMQVVIDKLNF